MKRNEKLEAIRKKMPAEVKLMIDHSFAVVDRIDELLKRKGISQRELAKKMEKKESEISKWMRGTHNFTLKTIAKLETVLGEPILSISKAQPSAARQPKKSAPVASRGVRRRTTKTRTEGAVGASR